jgi:RNA-directed DNA polymerase
MRFAHLLQAPFVWLIHGRGHGVEDLAGRLRMSEQELRDFEPAYREFTIAKRGGGSRRILAPDKPLKTLQRCILHRLLRRLRAHPAARGFERGQSIVTNALPHAGKAVVVRMDLKEFFASTEARRVYRYFRTIGWNRPASRLLVRLCTHEGGLPQGAPTSPRLSNLVNFGLDSMLAGVKFRYRDPRTGVELRQEAPFTYTRYADDLTFSFSEDNPTAIRSLIVQVKHIVGKAGYQLHLRKKLHIRRQHAQQRVTGLVVNRQVNLPRTTRRWLRAVEHRLSAGRATTLTPEQLAGWRALRAMVAKQGSSEGT